MEPTDESPARFLDSGPKAVPGEALVVVQEHRQDLVLDLVRDVGRPPLMKRITSGSLSSSTRLSTSSPVNRRNTRRSVSRKICIEESCPTRTGADTRDLAGVAEPRGDPGDRAEERAASLGALLLVLGAAVAAEQLDLDRVHRVDVRVAQATERCSDGMAVEQLSRPRRSEHARRPCARARRAIAPRARAIHSGGRARGSSRAISRLDLASVISRLSTSVRKNGHSR